MNSKTFLYWHPESECYFYEVENFAGDGLCECVNLMEETIRNYHTLEAEAKGVFIPTGLDFDELLRDEFPEQFTIATVPMPQAVDNKPLSRGRKSVAKKEAKPADSLLNALKFIEIAQKKIGSEQQQFCVISGGWAAASNGVLSVATKVEEDLNCCPHSKTFVEALKKSGRELSIVQISQTQLSVVSESLNIVVPCATLDSIFISPPDNNIAVIDDRIKAAFECCYPLLTETSPKAIFAALLLQANSCVSTNGNAMVEYWHGIDLPPGLLIPKVAAMAVAKTDKELCGFGYSSNSVTFWFKDESFIKTQLYNEHYPNYGLVLDANKLNFEPLPIDFFKGLRAIKPFSKDNQVYFVEGGICAQNNPYNEPASVYKIIGLPVGMGFNVDFMLQLETAFKNVCFIPDQGKVFFQAENCRGALMGLGKAKQHVTTDPMPAHHGHFTDDDIPY